MHPLDLKLRQLAKLEAIKLEAEHQKLSQEKSDSEKILGSDKVLKNLITVGAVNTEDIHFFLGYSGWDAGQLEDEIKEDSWLVTDVDENLIMQEANNSSWADFVKKAGNRYSIWENYPEFLKKQPSGKIDSRTIKVGCNTALDTGTYTFTFGDKSKAQARYTFTYGLVGDKWQITSHHSSLMPEQIASAM